MQSIKDHFDRTKADFLKHCISLIPMLEIIFFAITKRQSQAEEEAIKFQLLQEKKKITSPRMLLQHLLLEDQLGIICLASTR